MNARPHTGRGTGGLGLLTALVLAVLVGCASPDDDIVVRVDGWELRRGEMVDHLGALASVPAYLAAQELAGAAPVPVSGANPDGYDPRFVARYLNERVAFRLVAEELASRNLAVGDDDRAAAEAAIAGDLAAVVGSGSVRPDDFGSYRAVLVEGVAGVAVLREAMGEEAFADWLGGAARAAAVEVAPAYGRWDPGTGTIVVEADPGGQVTLVPGSAPR